MVGTSNQSVPDMAIDFGCAVRVSSEAAKLLPSGSVDAVDLNCGCPQAQGVAFCLRFEGSARKCGGK